jgi:hypothetical protein
MRAQRPPPSAASAPPTAPSASSPGTLPSATSAFGSNGVIIIVYDEDERAGGLAPKNGLGSGGHVVCAIISPVATVGSYSQKYYHYSLLRTLEDGFRLGGYLGNANAGTPVASIWRPPAG